MRLRSLYLLLGFILGLYLQQIQTFKHVEFCADRVFENTSVENVASFYEKVDLIHVMGYNGIVFSQCILRRIGGKV